VSDTTLASLSADPSIRRPSVRSLNRLERAGWVMLAREALGIRPGEASALLEMVMSPGRIVSYERLDACFGPHDGRSSSAASRRLGCYMARVRASLEDLGIPRAAIENLAGVGYGIAPHYARRLRQIVEDGE
jgi:DNA-binding response OmpR family regulator